MDDRQAVKPYTNGGEMWHDYAASYGTITARIICRRYLEMQEKTMAGDAGEMEFCRQLREEMAFAPNMKNAEVYLHSIRLAEYDGEMELYNESNRINRLCGADIDEAIYACEYGDGSHDFKTALGVLSDQYGLARVKIVLAAEAKWHGFMGQMPDEEYQWAQSLNLDEQFYGGFHLRTRPDVLIGLIAEMRKEVQAMAYEVKGQIDNKKELTREEMITAIMADILKHDPEHPKKSLESIEKNMRKKDISDLRDDYYFYFPNEKENTLNNEVKSELPSVIYKRHANPSRTAVNESFVQRYDKVGGVEIKPGAIVFWGTAADCNLITNKLNSGDISVIDVSILRDLSDYAEYHGMIANRMYPPLKLPLFDINQVTIDLCYKMGISAVPYTTLNNKNWNNALQNPEKTAKSLHLSQIQIELLEEKLNNRYPEYFPKAETQKQGNEKLQMQNKTDDFDLGFGPDENGVSVWNWLETQDENGNEKFIAHINFDREITYFSDSLPQNIIADIEYISRGDWKEMFAIEMEGMDYNPPNPRQEYSKEEIKQAENVDIKGFLTASYPDKVTLKGNQLLFKNAKDETVSVNVSDSDKNGLFFNTVTQGSGKGIINFLRQETGISFKNAVAALLTYSQAQAAVPEQSEKEKAAIAFHQERKLNIECGKAIDQALNDTYTPGEMAGTGYYDCKTAVKTVIDKYGVDRVALVLAANINDAEHDGRINAQNKAWARNINASDKPDFYLNAHKTVIDMFANRFREAIPQGYEQEAQIERSGFAPPDYAATTNNVVNYLTGKLSFDKGIVKSCIENGIIYQTDVYSEKLNKNVPCAVFAGFDNKGEMQSAVIKGFGSYEKVEDGSQLKHAFVLPAKETKGKQATAVSVFDNPLETLAGATLAKMKDKTNYANIHRVSVVKTWLISTHAKALRNFLENNPQVRTVNLCLTNTDDGRKIAESIKIMLRDYSEKRGESIKVNDLIPKDTKGFQEQLQNKIGEMKEKRKANENRE